MKPVVACVGDSTTLGSTSADWVGALAGRFPQYRFVNAGVGGEVAWTTLQRIGDVVALDPSVVTVMLGTNDARATTSPEVEQEYVSSQNLPRTPDQQWFVESVAAILAALTTGTRARIAVIGFPPLGEDLGSTLNQRVRAYNDALVALAEAHGAAYLPFFDRLAALLPADHSPPPYDGTIWTMRKANLRHRFLKRSWDAISMRNGLLLLTDHIHLNDRAGAVLADLVADFLTEPPVQAPPVR